MKINLEEYNKEVKAWGKDFIPELKNHAARLGITHRASSPSKGASVNRFKNRFVARDGAVEKISVTFPRTLIYTHKGAGKGRGGSKGSKWVDRFGNTKKTDARSFGKMATGGRTAKPFINNALDGAEGVNKLATIVAEKLGDALVGSLFIK